MTYYRDPENQENLDDTRVPMSRQQFLSLCAAGASAILFGAACGLGGENEDGEENEQENGGGGEENDQENGEEENEEED